MDEDTTKEDMISCCKTLESAKTKYCVYYVFGNNDKGYYPDSYLGYGDDDLVKELKDSNVKVLQYENVLIDFI